MRICETCKGTGNILDEDDGKHTIGSIWGLIFLFVMGFIGVAIVVAFLVVVLLSG